MTPAEQRVIDAALAYDKALCDYPFQSWQLPERLECLQLAVRDACVGLIHERAQQAGPAPAGEEDGS